ncbi:helix-turn-helix domain-containing protein [Paenibacillus ferrarius]|uniref:helix-turn-helix domain-containing protein n=1 Tax=Paenibacillus ferrarius TaxID=1469647 RepID=UPI003D2CC0A7
MMKQFEGFGKFLESLRGKMSLREAANKSGLSHAYIRDLELERNRSTNEKIKPSPVTLKKLSEAYKFSYTELMEKAGYLEHTELSDTPTNEKLDHIPLSDIVYIEISPTELKFHTRLGHQVVNMKSLLDFVHFLDKLEEHGFKKMDTDLFVNLTQVQKYVEKEGKLYFDPLGIHKSVTIAASRQKKYHDLIVRSVAVNSGGAIPLPNDRGSLDTLFQSSSRNLSQN